jgi:hypothetical protein
MKFHEFLNHRLHYIAQYPHDSHGYDLQVPPDLLQRMQQEFLNTVRRWNKGRARQAVREEIENNRLEIHLRRALYRIKTLGGDLWQDSERVEKLCRYVVSYIGRNFPIDIERRSFTFGERTEDEEIESLFDELDLHRLTSYKGFDGLEYATHNNLCIWTGKEWVITSLGILYLRLSTIHQIMMLLQTEVILAATEFEPSKMELWHMPKQLIEKLVQDKGFHFALDDENEIEKYDPVLAYTSRLEDMGLLWSEDVSEQVWETSDPPNVPIIHAGDDHFEIRVTALGEKVLQEILSSEGKWLDGLIRIGLDPTFFSVTRFSLDVESLIGSLRTELTCNPAFEEQRIILQKALDDLKAGTSLIVVLRGLQPSVEKFLKNILRIEGLINQEEYRTLTLAPILGKYESQTEIGKGILSDEIIRYIRVLDRNGILHANLNPPDEMALIFVTLLVSVLRSASEEYRTHKGLVTH